VDKYNQIPAIEQQYISSNSRL